MAAFPTIGRARRSQPAKGGSGAAPAAGGPTPADAPRSASEAGRMAPRVGAVVPFMVTEDVSAGRALAAEKFGIFDSLPRYKRMVELGGARSAADVCIVGDEKTLRDALVAYRDVGLTDFLAAPLCGAERSASWQRSAEALAWAMAEIT